MDVIRKTLLESETVQIGLFEARAVSDACGDVEFERYWLGFDNAQTAIHAALKALRLLCLRQPHSK